MSDDRRTRGPLESQDRPGGSTTAPPEPRPPAAAACIGPPAKPLTRLPRVTVVMPVRDERATIEWSLRSVLAQDYPADLLDVVVADGGSCDGTPDVVRAVARDAAANPGRVPVRVVPNPSGHAASGMNAGVAAAAGDVVIRLDGHAAAAPDFVRRSVAALGETGVACVGGVLATTGDGVMASAVALAMSTRFGAGSATFRTGIGVSGGTGHSGPRTVDTAAFGAYRRQTLLALGGFDESFPRNQDDELNLRITLGGGRIVLDPAIHATYRCTRGPLAAAAQYFRYGLHKTRVLRRHGRLGSLRAAAPAALVAAVAATSVAAILGSAMPLVALGGLYAAVTIAASIAAVAPRRAWSVLPMLPLAYAALHLGYGAGFWCGVLLAPFDRTRAILPFATAAPDARRRSDRDARPAAQLCADVTVPAHRLANGPAKSPAKSPADDPANGTATAPSATSAIAGATGSTGATPAPADTPPDTRTHTHSVAATFHRRDAHADADPASPAERFLVAERERALARMATIQRVHGESGPLRVLDIGCGRGTSLGTAEALGAAGARTTGIDLLPARLAAAAATSPRTALAAADAARLPFRTGAFDAALLFTALGSMPSGDTRRRAAQEAIRVVAAGGVVLVWELRVARPGGDGRAFSLRDLRAMFPGAAIDATTAGLLPPIARAVVPLSLAVARALAAIPFLRSHRIVAIRAQTSAAPGLPRWAEVPLAVVAGIVALPVLGAAAAAVAVSSRGPVLHRALRAGRHGRPIAVWKFRTMRTAAAGPRLTVARDLRVTPVGRVLRALHIDELPQIWNVLRGDMALVGPRPEDVALVDPRDEQRRITLSVRPGIVGPAQIAWSRREGEILAAASASSDDVERVYREQIVPAKLACDVAYLETRTAWSDLAWIARTALHVLRLGGRGGDAA